MYQHDYPMIQKMRIPLRRKPMLHVLRRDLIRCLGKDYPRFNKMMDGSESGPCGPHPRDVNEALRRMGAGGEE